MHMTDMDPIETSSYGSPNRMHVLANGDIVDCGRLPQTARNNLYKTELCKHFVDSGSCRYGSKCQFAHGEDELRGVLRHPKYKTTRCKAFLSTGRCIYGSRCRFIHTRHPGDEDQRFANYRNSDMSSTASESDDLETQSKDLLVNPYGNALEPIDLSLPFGGFNQHMSLAPLTGVSPPKPEFDSYLSRGPFFDYSFESSDLGSFDLSRSSISSCSGETLNALSPRSSSSTESVASRFSRLTIFQRICREDD
ncbi:zinc finger domain containing protein [Plasmopara halstedii]|uniref:Zinc finger domain containing protein n=1 Tax=Plasmopara halstedii TaxID=4781 RepID=A0A0P1AQM7_PLAHL|nr:zinc finger domain containing protein [Plasmopara halstedii]CEG43586.1 zinc finger domain containing protein [Plasmopara halstedii]|eukprot:XP_024579955.1 zinc finger domain containing protein [Plasmopara halstedii]